ncbi:tRNA pseudouridine(38-40) synthase TruA [Paludibaculum fermentans]|uniref:tRNA pseudouridine(38-40) synthase TruA n=1 Tax=Paludibaculum fermentans TaxID=1473598 RepID=UPI003EB83166
MRRIRITVAYDGTEFHGWQVQPGLPTIQGWLEQILTGIESAPVHVHGSGRTDAGVHALAQVAAFDLENPIPCDNLRKAVNRLLPRSIRVTAVEEAAAAFHPRFQAKEKTYEYRIWREEICPPMRRLYVFHHPYPLNEAAITAAAPLLEGEHDFTAFAAADEKDELGRSKVRRIFASSVWREGGELVYRVRGSGFLKHMVRMIMGTLLEVGKGNLTADDLLARLQPGYPAKSGPAVPASGLCLLNVEY